MPSDIAIGVLAALMALLGAIVSIHAPTDKNWKIGYVITFVVLAAASTYFVVQQSTENADTNKHAAVALAKLGACVGDN